MLNEIVINGQKFTRRSVSIRLNGAELLRGVDTIEWSDELPQELVSPMGEGAPLAKASGNYGCSASISFYTADYALFQAAVLALDPLAAGNLSRVQFSIAIVPREGASFTATILSGCSIKGRSASVGNDGSALVTKVDLQPLVIRQDGASLVSPVPGI